MGASCASCSDPPLTNTGPTLSHQPQTKLCRKEGASPLQQLHLQFPPTASAEPRREKFPLKGFNRIPMELLALILDWVPLFQKPVLLSLDLRTVSRRLDAALAFCLERMYRSEQGGPGVENFNDPLWRLRCGRLFLLLLPSMSPQYQASVQEIRIDQCVGFSPRELERTSWEPCNGASHPWSHLSSPLGCIPALSRLPNLKMLDLGLTSPLICPSTKDGENPALAYALEKLLVPNPFSTAPSEPPFRALQTLHLSGKLIGPSGGESFAKVLRLNRTLTTLTLCNNLIDSAAAGAIAEALKYNESLKTLGLSWNQIGNVGAKEFASMLGVNTTLTVLDLQANDIGTAGATLLAVALMETNTLQALDLTRNTIGPAAVVQFNEVLHANETLIEVMVDAVEIIGLFPDNRLRLI